VAVHHALDVRQSSRQQTRHRRSQAIRRYTIAASAHAQTAAARADDGQQMKLESTAENVQQLLA